MLVDQINSKMREGMRALERVYLFPKKTLYWNLIVQKLSRLINRRFS
jgi:hypothetical protein